MAEHVISCSTRFMGLLFQCIGLFGHPNSMSAYLRFLLSIHLHLYVFLSVYICIFVFVFLSICLFVVCSFGCLSICLFMIFYHIVLCLYFSQCVLLSACMKFFVCLSACLPACLSSCMSA